MDKSNTIEILESNIVKNAMSCLDADEIKALEDFVNNFLIEVDHSMSVASEAILKDPKNTKDIIDKLISNGVLKQWLTQERR